MGLYFLSMPDMCWIVWEQNLAARDSQDAGLRDQAFAFSEMSGKEENQSEPCNGRPRPEPVFGRNEVLSSL